MTMSRIVLCSVLAVGVLSASSNARSDDASSSGDLKSIRQEIESLKKGQDEILKQMEDIKKLLTAKAEKPAVRDIKVDISLKGEPMRGNKDAKIVLLEYSEYQCPFCARHFTQTQPELDKQYIDTGKVLHVFKDFPLAFHKEAPKAAEATLCAQDQSKYWEMHAKLFANAKALKPEDLVKYAEELGLDMAKFKECLDSGAKAASIKADMEEAGKAGITGTPSIVLAVRSASDPDKVVGIKAMSGARPFDFFKTEIDKLLETAK
jgi:protein-disulfide isomerase